MKLTFDTITTGAFHAIKRGVMTVNATIAMLHIGASDINRKIVGKVLFGNDVILVITISSYLVFI